ncbi:MAG: hypothetical protein E6K41_01650 [Gammaproteobacteria bacterium]|nr:MAG: hypothetical protein E6K41_01650 [Gammaproteobacteria bacterium]TLY91102.1 MAG: hypothetical protein E6K38_14375 [Gammaproteobacteria bacterium]TLZ54983.1 MAG: hypothetical protein E6K22_04145 [Gammaproteobacteria bacterium]TLZ59875.1 MAG: hypothetical protein E6K20_14185 [Gammaproteobacteria bacterium]
MWKNIRILFLLLVLAGVAIHAWLDRIATQGWKETLWVGLYPLNGDGTPSAQRYIDGLTVKDFAGIEAFFAHEAHRYGVSIEQPVHVELYPQGSELPPALAPGAGPLGIAWWSLKLRWFAAHATKVPGRAPPRIRVFVLYHDPSTLDTVPDSHGLQKGLVGVVHAFALPAMAGSNNIVIAHELMHTLGASDKYAPGSGEPLYPIGFADPERQPLYPQTQAEIMAGRRALSAQEFEMPQGLRDVVVGPSTALEIHWARP